MHSSAYNGTPSKLPILLRESLPQQLRGRLEDGGSLLEALWSKRLIVINAELLRITFDNKSCFLFRNSAIWYEVAY